MIKLEVTSRLGSGLTTIVAPGPILANKVQQTLLRQAQHQLLRHAQQALPNWPYIYKIATGIPSQGIGYDCGVFVSQYAEHLTRFVYGVCMVVANALCYIGALR